LNRPEYAIIVAGGKGTRIPGKTPKQFLELCGKPILLHTLDAFFRCDQNINVILVLPPGDIETWKTIVKKYNFNHPVILQQGGNTRFQSVKNGLKKIEGDGLVAIHDGVRPLVSEAIIRASFILAAAHSSAVASVTLKESLRITDHNKSQAVDRSHYRLIQTPQTFDLALIRKAYETIEDASLTDDASVAERAGHTIHLFDGSYENIKITTPEDLLFAEAILKAKTGL
jgi:2-C-methyl-D-erythritol 4-phosphate cytidylyltransferase